MIRITVSFPDDQHEWLSAEAERSGISMGSVLRAVVDAAKRRGWEVSQGTGPQVREPD